jgi:APA family basic amino acid/polyamine antiporter
MTGFESVTKAAEEANPEFRSSSFFKAIAMAILVGALFYAIVIAAVGYVAPWKQFMGHEFMTAVVFERAIGSHWIVSVILAAALLSLLKCFNGNFVAASRLLFAMGRRGLIDDRVAEVHAVNQTPSIAVLCVGIATALCMFLGDAILVPISEVGSVASASGWLAACAAYYALGPPARERAVAMVGVAVGLMMIFMKIVPLIPGHFSGYEWLSLAIWAAIGAILGWRGHRGPRPML